MQVVGILACDGAHAPWQTRRLSHALSGATGVVVSEHKGPAPDLGCNELQVVGAEADQDRCPQSSTPQRGMHAQGRDIAFDQKRLWRRPVAQSQNRSLGAHPRDHLLDPLARGLIPADELGALQGVGFQVSHGHQQGVIRGGHPKGIGKSLEGQVIVGSRR